MERVRDILIVFAVIAVMLVALSSISARPWSGTNSDALYEAFEEAQPHPSTIDTSLTKIDTGIMTRDAIQTACIFAANQVDDLCDGDVNIRRRMFFGDKTMNKTPSSDNNTDPYYIQKIRPEDGIDNNSSLRLTINDDPEESFQIWGNSCKAGDCAGDGVQGHKFRADGTASHTGGLVVGDDKTATDNGWTSDLYPMGGSLNIYNRHAKNWSHFPWVDGRNYIRNDTQIDGNTRITGKVTVAPNGDPNFGVGIFGNSGKDGATPDVYNGGLDSWYGIGFRCRLDDKTRFVHDTRTGTVNLYSGNGAKAALCIDDVCVNADDLRKINELVQNRATKPVFVLGAWNMKPWGMNTFADKSAKWIWNEANAASNAGTSCITFEKKFDVSEATPVVLHMFIDDTCTVFLNGAKIGSTSWTGAPVQMTGRTIVGKNTLLIQAKNNVGPAGLIATVIASSSNTILVRTDETWRWAGECTIQ